ncbi:hypothetical protein J2T19_003843 [Paenibacillus tundrae]|uniref:Uncharacterized protein n=1 Tax=Paenibacillus tundrae TaxID=528187 RepID=A0ABT9WH04_9BACL|nr:hypothetical protein [Paenibacillus tundrae]
MINCRDFTSHAHLGASSTAHVFSRSLCHFLLTIRYICEKRPCLNRKIQALLSFKKFQTHSDQKEPTPPLMVITDPNLNAAITKWETYSEGGAPLHDHSPLSFPALCPQPVYSHAYVYACDPVYAYALIYDYFISALPSKPTLGITSLLDPVPFPCSCS